MLSLIGFASFLEELLQRITFLIYIISDWCLAVLHLGNMEPMTDSSLADSSDHEKCAFVFVPGSTAALVCSESEEPSSSRPTRWRRTKGCAGHRHLKPQRCVKLTAPIWASPGAETSTSSTSSFPGAKESPAGVPLCSLPWCSHQHPQCPHRSCQEPRHEDQGGSQRRTYGKNWQKEMKWSRCNVE